MSKVHLKFLELGVWINEGVIMFVVKFSHLAAFETSLGLEKTQVYLIYWFSCAKISLNMKYKLFSKFS